MTANTTVAESGAAIIAKVTPPISVSLATISGMQVSELVLWATLVYTALLIGHRLLMIYRDMRSGKSNSDQ